MSTGQRWFSGQRCGRVQPAIRGHRAKITGGLSPWALVEGSVCGRHEILRCAQKDGEGVTLSARQRVCPVTARKHGDRMQSPLQRPLQGVPIFSCVCHPERKSKGLSGAGMRCFATLSMTKSMLKASPPHPQQASSSSSWSSPAESSSPAASSSPVSLSSLLSSSSSSSPVSLSSSSSSSVRSSSP